MLSDFFNEFIRFPFDEPAAKKAEKVRAKLATLGTPISPYDLQIAAIACQRGYHTVKSSLENKVR